jgi:membrane associated rhomboid family serine protease
MRAKAPVVLALVAINVVVYIIQRMSPGFTERFVSNPTAISDGEWWRLITPMFLHSPSDPLHIILNMLVLWIYGPDAEQAFGSVRFAAIYLICGFCGDAASYAFGPPVNSLGASGAIFGIVGVLVVYLYRRKSSQLVAQYLRSLTFFIGLNVVLGFAIANIDYWAHFGGLAAGVLLGLGLERGGRRVPTAAQVAVLASVTLLGIALVVLQSSSQLA